jgi:hypothetical protein
MRHTELTLEPPVLSEREPSVAALARANGIAMFYAQEMTADVDDCLQKCEATSGMSDIHLSHGDIMARYEELTAGYDWTDFSRQARREAFEQRIRVMQDANSLLTVRADVFRGAALSELDTLVRKTVERINTAPVFDPNSPVDDLADMADEVKERLTRELQWLQSDVQARPEAYGDTRLAELERTLVAADNSLKPLSELPPVYPYEFPVQARAQAPAEVPSAIELRGFDEEGERTGQIVVQLGARAMQGNIAAPERTDTALTPIVRRVA